MYPGYNQNLFIFQLAFTKGQPKFQFGQVEFSSTCLIGQVLQNVNIIPWYVIMYVWGIKHIDSRQSPVYL